jgi:hypothetical protein
MDTLGADWIMQMFSFSNIDSWPRRKRVTAIFIFGVLFIALFQFREIGLNIVLVSICLFMAIVMTMGIMSVLGRIGPIETSTLAK